MLQYLKKYVLNIITFPRKPAAITQSIAIVTSARRRRSEIIQHLKHRSQIQTLAFAFRCFFSRTSGGRYARLVAVVITVVGHVIL